MYAIFEEDLPVLLRAFKAVLPNDVFLDAVSFRATHDGDLGTLETLERRGHLRRKADNYYLWPTALAAIASQADDAGQILLDCGTVLAALRIFYKEKPRDWVPLKALVRHSGLDEARLRIALWYVAKSDLLAAHTPNLMHASDPAVLPREEILQIYDAATFLERLHRLLGTDRHWGASTREASLPKSRKLPAANGTVRLTGPAVFPAPLAQLLAEIDQALAQELRALACMGLRTIVDMVCNELVGDIGGFDRKIDALQRDGHITEANRRALSIVVDAGNASAHRGFVPSQDQMGIVYRIVTHLAEATYLMPTVEENFKDIPRRPTRRRS